MPKISACIVAYCDYDEVCAAVRSILHYTPAPDLALYVVDNGSPDGCGRQLAETDFGDSRVTVLPLEKNIGFGNRLFGKISMFYVSYIMIFTIYFIFLRHLQLIRSYKMKSRVEVAHGH